MPPRGLAVTLDVGLKAHKVNEVEWLAIGLMGVIAVWRTKTVGQPSEFYNVGNVRRPSHCDWNTHRKNITAWHTPDQCSRNDLRYSDRVFVWRRIAIQQVHGSVWIHCRHPLENRRSCWRRLQRGTICACWDKTEGISIPPGGKYSSDQSIGCCVSILFHIYWQCQAVSCLPCYPLKSWDPGGLETGSKKERKKIPLHPWKEHMSCFFGYVAI